uniref:C2H2-type domain-containing protein n=1 Tax=Sexangularia sp. CB-2014 TaxID=1486929 RepID=A0A7S1V4H1_9EUKA|mmetsp:Transcript_10581/g.33526  ORF Transcript_10581/g.33526 Transcript_10581/m.33526 type:complete len:412 (+) Transcript_10581:154-1389(+)
MPEFDCSICSRRFPSQAALTVHREQSSLHQENLAVLDQLAAHSDGLICTLCLRQFSSRPLLARHMRESQLHRQNLVALEAQPSDSATVDGALAALDERGLRYSTRDTRQLDAASLATAGLQRAASTAVRPASLPSSPPPSPSLPRGNSTAATPAAASSSSPTTSPASPSLDALDATVPAVLLAVKALTLRAKAAARTDHANPHITTRCLALAHAAKAYVSAVEQLVASRRLPASPASLTLSDVVSLAATRALFRAHLAAQLSQENLEFYEAVQSYKVTAPTRLAATGAALVRTFLDPATAEAEVNVSGAARAFVHSSLASPNAATLRAAFSFAERDCWRNMRDHLSSFKEQRGDELAAALRAPWVECSRGLVEVVERLQRAVREVGEVVEGVEVECGAVVGAVWKGELWLD